MLTNFSLQTVRGQFARFNSSKAAKPGFFVCLLAVLSRHARQMLRPSSWTNPPATLTIARSELSFAVKVLMPGEFHPGTLSRVSCFGLLKNYVRPSPPQEFPTSAINTTTIRDLRAKPISWVTQINPSSVLCSSIMMSRTSSHLRIKARRGFIQTA